MTHSTTPTSAVVSSTNGLVIGLPATHLSSLVSMLATGENGKVVSAHRTLQVVRGEVSPAEMTEVTANNAMQKVDSVNAAELENILKASKSAEAPKANVYQSPKAKSTPRGKKGKVSADVTGSDVVKVETPEGDGTSLFDSNENNAEE